jgi:hypothetical protein
VAYADVVTTAIVVHANRTGFAVLICQALIVRIVLVRYLA